MSDIPIIFIHSGNQPYLKITIEQAKKVSSRVILIGDVTNKALCNEHYLIDQIKTPELIIFKNAFVNYSTNNASLELFCFLRLFFMREIMKKINITSAIHLDSDCMLLNNIFDGRLAYIYNNRYKDHELKMSASISTSCLTLDFLNKFIKICFDIYVNKTRFNLIQHKIDYHQKNNVPGGICDMTLYYILANELKVHNLLDLQEDGSTFDDNINDTMGFDGYNTFTLTNGIKQLKKENDKIYALCNNGNFVKINNLHFQGPAKRHIMGFYV